VTLKGQTRDPNTLKAQYLENLYVVIGTVGPSCTADSAARRSPPPSRSKAVPGKQTVDRGVGLTPAPSPRDHHHRLPFYLGAVPPYLGDPHHPPSFVDASLGQYFTSSS